MNTDTIMRDLSSIKFRTNVKFFQLTTLGVGSVAPLVADVADECELVTLLRYCSNNNIRIFLPVLTYPTQIAQPTR